MLTGSSKLGYIGFMSGGDMNMRIPYRRNTFHELPKQSEKTERQIGREVMEEALGEVWKSVAGWPYEVSSWGQVRRSKEGGNRAKVGECLKLIQKSNGYLAVTLHRAVREDHGDKRYWKDKKAKQFLVHRLVYEAFYGPIPSKMQTNHRDGVKINNRLSNLECITPQGNMRHARLFGLTNWKGERNGRSKINEDIVREIRVLDGVGVDWHEIAKRFKISWYAVKHVVKRTRWAHVK